jgi:hypothetical protein
MCATNSSAGYSIVKWIDEDGDSKYDVLEAETRYFKGPRMFAAFLVAPARQIPRWQRIGSWLAADR